MQTDHTPRGKNRTSAETDGDYRRDQPKILTEHFAADLAMANRARRAQRFPWLERNLATLSQLDLGTSAQTRTSALNRPPAQAK